MRKAIILGALAIFAASCTTNPYTGEKRAGRVVTSGAGGAAAGAAAGAIIGAATGSAGKGALIGAAAGAAIGAGIGVYQDQQQAKLRERLVNAGVQVQRDGDNIRLIMPSDITFDTARSDIKGSFYQTLNAVAEVLDEFDKTTISVAGHADARGSDSYNMDLSQRRALSVSNYLSSQGVDAARLNAIGFGETRPVGDNSTAAGQGQNRRVEITIDPVESQFRS
jgi:outer membrane protein OmpA-like peptidoglycan-associated protein